MSVLHSVSRPSRAGARRVLWANLVGQIGIIVTGGAVRLTGSGLGCSDWPQCEPGEFTPVRHEATSFHPYVEFGNRTLTGVLVLLALASLWVVWRDRDSSRWLRALAVVPIVGVLAQAVIGGMAVLVDLHPAVVGSHFLVSILLVVGSTVLVLRHRDLGAARPGWAVAGRTRALLLALVAVQAVVQVLGTVVTGSGPHSGDDHAPYRYAVDPLLVTRSHSLAVWLYLGLLVAVWLDLRRTARAGAPAATRALAQTTALLGLALAQGAIGYLQYFLGLPVVLVGLHMLGAALTVAAQSAQVVAVRPPSAEPAGAPAAPAAPAAEPAAAA